MLPLPPPPKRADKPKSGRLVGNLVVLALLLVTGFLALDAGLVWLGRDLRLACAVGGAVLEAVYPLMGLGAALAVLGALAWAGTGFKSGAALAVMLAGVALGLAPEFVEGLIPRRCAVYAPPA